MQLSVAVSGVRSQHLERLLRGEVEPFGQHPLRLLDHYPAVQCGLQLRCLPSGLRRLPLLEESDGRDVGERLPKSHIRLTEWLGPLPGQNPRTHDLLPPPPPDAPDPPA